MQVFTRSRDLACRAELVVRVSPAEADPRSQRVCGVAAWLRRVRPHELTGTPEEGL